MDAHELARQQGANTRSGLNKMSQLILTALFALALSFLTFAASFADVPRSEVLVIEQQE